MLDQIYQVLLENLEAIPFVPRNLVLNPVDFGVVLRAGQNLGILLDGVDSLPSARFSKRNDIPSHAGEAVDDNGLLSWRRGGNMFRRPASLC